MVLPFHSWIARNSKFRKLVAQRCFRNLLVASSAAARVFDGLARRFVYACYLDVDIAYNHSYIVCTGTRLP